MAAPVCRRIPCKISELNLSKTLASGQCFRWKEISSGRWRGVILDNVWTLWQTNTDLFYDVFTKDREETIKQETKNTENCTKLSKHKKENRTNSKNGKSLIGYEQNDVTSNMPMKSGHVTNHATCKHSMKSDEGASIDFDREVECKKIKIKKMDDIDNLCYHGNQIDHEIMEKKLREYFRLDIKLASLYDKWSVADSNFKKTSEHFEGIRMLRQDPVENLFSFICSSNNHISRISSMVEKLCYTYGEEIGQLDGQIYFSFPSVSSLAQEGVEEKLKTLGFGYRAKYIYQSAKYIQENCDESWLYGLRNKPYKEVKTELMKLCGVGGKVADCVCLMSMDKLEVVPVDTHVYQIAARDYMPRLRQAKSLTDKLYNEIGDHFRELWGDKAGWAHSILFTADLKQFKGKTGTKEDKETDSIKLEIPSSTDPSPKDKKLKRKR